jgi:hypothetical protein
MWKENLEALKEFWAFIKGWSKTAWFLVITSILYVVLAFYLKCVVGHRDGIEIAQIAYVVVLSVGLVIVYTFKKRM